MAEGEKRQQTVIEKLIGLKSQIHANSTSSENLALLEEAFAEERQTQKSAENEEIVQTLYEQIRGLLSGRAAKETSSEELAEFEMLMGRLVQIDRFLFRKMIEYMVVRGFSKHYQRLLFGASNLVQHLEDDSGVSRHRLLFMLLMTQTFHRSGLGVFDNSMNECLVYTCQAGLLSTPIVRPENGSGCEPFQPFWKVSPIHYAVTFNQPDLVKFLYSTGIVSNREVFQLSQDPALVQRCAGQVTTRPAASDDFPSIHDVLAVREIRSFLVAKASEPRSLKRMCLAEVSKDLGWGNARKAAVKKIRIPPTLKDDLMTNCDTSMLRYKIT